MLILPEYELIRQIYQGDRTVLFRAIHKPTMEKLLSKRCGRIFRFLRM